MRFFGDEVKLTYEKRLLIPLPVEVVGTDWDITIDLYEATPSQLTYNSVSASASAPARYNCHSINCSETFIYLCIA